MAQFDFTDDRDRDLLAAAICGAIRDLAQMSQRLGEYEIGTMGIQDTIARYKRMLRDITEQ